ncbi:MAG: DUF1538 domain-containing protein [Spirochaeta sp.]|nr:DUF1538 domain-containing protein [Spirochaeta sp.]
MKIPHRAAFSLVVAYVGRKLYDQLRSVAFIVGYLLVFQLFVLRIPIANAAVLAFGLAISVFGLALFLEGLVLGLMPLGEFIGLRLPEKTILPVILAFGVALGLAATFAEPAIGALRAAGSAVVPWESPLLFALLHRYAEHLVAAIATGVGVAVGIGMLRFAYGLSIKPFVFAFTLILIALTVIAAFDSALREIIGIAWDSGGVTTGPVTVPLVLALGIGVARSYGSTESPTSGFGVVMLASAAPIVAVFVLCMVLAPTVPRFESREAFLSPESHEQATQLFASETQFEEFTKRLSDDAPDAELGIAATLSAYLWSSTRAVLLLAGGFVLVLLIFVRERVRRQDEILLGVFLTVLGLTLLGGGIELGLARLGDDVGRRLPVAFSSIELPEQQIRIRNFDDELLQQALTPDGRSVQFFYLAESDGFRPVPFGRWAALGQVLILVFAFGMGYGATLAEPALRALGRTVEQLTVGTFRADTLIRTVSIGVGIGLGMGMARILWDIPLPILLIPPYVLLLPLTAVSAEEFAAIAWDSAGVTTGPVTVPLVVAMGIGVGGAVGVSDGFGVLALASVYPILAVTITGIMLRRHQNLIMHDSERQGIR